MVDVFVHKHGRRILLTLLALLTLLRNLGRASRHGALLEPSAIITSKNHSTHHNIEQQRQNTSRRRRVSSPASELRLPINSNTEASNCFVTAYHPLASTASPLLLLHLHRTRTDPTSTLPTVTGSSHDDRGIGLEQHRPGPHHLITTFTHSTSPLLRYSTRVFQSWCEGQRRGFHSADATADKACSQFTTLFTTNQSSTPPTLTSTPNLAKPDHNTPRIPTSSTINSYICFRAYFATIAQHTSTTSRCQK